MDLYEIRWHARGGQGAKTAAVTLAQSAIELGEYAQGFPHYGPERMGAPIVAFTRLDDEPIRVHSHIYHPDIVVVLDPTLIGQVAVAAGLKDKGSIIINTAEPPAALRDRLGLAPTQGAYAVDASKIALDEIKRDIPNTPMIGALLKVSGKFDLEAVAEDIRAKFQKKLGDKIADGNVRALRRAFDEVQGGAQ